MAAPGPFEPSPQTASPTSRMAVRPPEVRASFLLWVLTVVLGLIDTVVVWAVTKSLVEGARSAGRIVVATNNLGYDLVRWAIGAALVLAFALVMRRGHNWARIVLTVLGAVGIAALVGGLVVAAVLELPEDIALTVGGPAGVALDLLRAVVISAAIVVSYRPRANTWFTQPRL